MLTPDQKKLLDAPLGTSHIKARTQAGRQLSYIEGWFAIAEANRIFGFDGWTSETTELRCVAEKEREIGAAKRPGHGVSYTARVRIRVGEIVREGVGAGHGIDVDLGLAHESAIKEAETDARKRALMTFGNPFGLALYDKERANVVDDSEPPPRAGPATSPTNTILPAAEADKVQKELMDNINGCITVAEINAYLSRDPFKAAFSRLPDRHRGYVRLAAKARGENLKPKENAA